MLGNETATPLRFIIFTGHTSFAGVDEVEVARQRQTGLGGEASTAPSVQQLTSPQPARQPPQERFDITVPAIGAAVVLGLAGLAWAFRGKLKSAPAPPGFDALTKVCALAAASLLF